ncbi:MAG TPA: hypothetical protein DCG34_05780 [Clostridiales bacterium]|jgi:hypothetical protein|nr:hypothetical protein [Clostridiales bacterium]
MNKIISRALLLSVMVGLLVVSADYSHATEGSATYKTNIIKGRAAKGYTNRGTAVYNYVEINKYNDGIGGEEIGNLDVKSNVREVHNGVVIKNGVKSKKEDLDIGKIEVKKPHSSLEVDNNVVVKGSVKASSAKDIELGTVSMGNNGTTTKDVDSNVHVKGGINAR